MHHLTFLQAIVIGALQGITEMFPISSLGHSVLVPALIGGSWKALVTQQSQGESSYLAFVVGLHVATATALICFFWRDWVALIGGFFRTLRYRRIRTAHERLIWLLIIATIPAGLTGLAFEHTFRTLFAKPLAAAAFLCVNAAILFAAEGIHRRQMRQRSQVVDGPGAMATDAQPDRATELDTRIVRRLRVGDALVVGIFQIGALLAGISRSGITMAAGMARGLDREAAVRFAFLLATPIILAAGLLKIPDLTGHLGNGIRPQVLAGSGVAFVCALVSTGLLVRWVRTKTLLPFAVYSLLFGVCCLFVFA